MVWNKMYEINRCSPILSHPPSSSINLHVIRMLQLTTLLLLYIMFIVLKWFQKRSKSQSENDGNYSEANLKSESLKVHLSPHRNGRSSIYWCLGTTPFPLASWWAFPLSSLKLSWLFCSFCSGWPMKSDFINGAFKPKS